MTDDQKTQKNLIKMARKIKSALKYRIVQAYQEKEFGRETNFDLGKFQVVDADGKIVAGENYSMSARDLETWIFKSGVCEQAMEKIWREATAVPARQVQTSNVEGSI